MPKPQANSKHLPLSAHQLARQLLAGPDHPVLAVPLAGGVPLPAAVRTLAMQPHGEQAGYVAVLIVGQSEPLSG